MIPPRLITWAVKCEWVLPRWGWDNSDANRIWVAICPNERVIELFFFLGGYLKEQVRRERLAQGEPESNLFHQKDFSDCCFAIRSEATKVNTAREMRSIKVSFEPTRLHL